MKPLFLKLKKIVNINLKIQNKKVLYFKECLNCFKIFKNSLVFPVPSSSSLINIL